MSAARPKRSRHYGYRTPFYDESCSERLYFEELQKPGANLLPIGRQLRVYEREKLDLLAIDNCLELWLFEFKRDVAQYDSIAQLITYGSYVSQWSRQELISNYKTNHPKRSLPNDFRSRFRREFTTIKGYSVNLVLAAYEFSLACRRGIEFLRQSGGLWIGRLKIDCLWDGNENPKPTYQWLERPLPTKPLDLHTEPFDALAYYMLDIGWNCFNPTWKECLTNRILPLYKFGDVVREPIPVHAGVFVRLTIPDEDNENPRGKSQLSYGLTTGPAIDLRLHLDEFELNGDTTNEVRNSLNPYWVQPIHWIRTDHAMSDSSIMGDFSPGLTEIDKFAPHANELKSMIQVETHMPF